MRLFKSKKQPENNTDEYNVKKVVNPEGETIGIGWADSYSNIWRGARIVYKGEIHIVDQISFVAAGYTST